MQAPNHVLAGVLIEKVFSGVKSRWLRGLLIAITGLLLHSIFDRIASLTYHPPQPDFKSLFWVSYHVLVLVGFIVSLYYFWKPYHVGIIFSILPDFDWVIIHGKEILGIRSGFYGNPWIHEGVHWLVDRVPPFSLLQHLPDLTTLPVAVLFELFIAGSMLYLIVNAPFAWNSEELDEPDMEES